MKRQSNPSPSSTPHTSLSFSRRVFANSQKDDCCRGGSPLNSPRGPEIINNPRLFLTLTPCDMSRPSIYPRAAELQWLLLMARAGISPRSVFDLGSAVISLSCRISSCCFGLILISKHIPKCYACTGLIRKIKRSNGQRGEMGRLSDPFLLGNVAVRVPACPTAATALYSCAVGGSSHTDWVGWDLIILH